MPARISGGEQQRVALARALVLEPEVLLMDEPLSNLDAKLRLEMRAEIRRIHNQLGSTTIYVTHDQDEALSLADRIVVLRDGQIRQVGRPEDLYAAPAHLDVAEFMGFRNSVRGTVSALAGDTATVSIGAAPISGRAADGLSVGGPAVVAVRPDDLVAGEQGLAAAIESVEYRGREFVGIARMADDTELVFHATERLEPGTPVKLAVDAARAIVFPAAA
jgi:putative spermidine/putrescine transport system ATP-binding protein